MLYSFDLFDTLITRRTFSPKGIFLIMQEKLKTNTIFSADFVGNFADLRIEAERAVRSKLNREVGLLDIYLYMAQMYSLDKLQTLYLIKLELNMEKNCLVPITENVNLLKSLMNKNDVIIISDMYISAKRIKNILLELDEVFLEIPIYVSCDMGCSKQSGEIFSVIRSRYNIDYNNWTHIGDNYLSDYLIPQALNINAKHYKRQDYNNYKLYKPGYVNSEFIEETVRGLNNLMFNYANKNDNMFEFGYQFSGYILYTYVSWILDNTLNNKIEKLYFIARDGYILKKVADLIIAKYQIKIKTFYIYGSRRAWRLDSKDNKNIDLLREYIGNNIDFSSKLAFVDSNGTGESIEGMSQFIDEWKNCIDVYYYSFVGKGHSKKCRHRSFCFEGSDLIEYLTSGTHGTTLGYVKNGNVIPLLEVIENPCNIETYIDGILALCSNIIELQNRLGMKIDFRHYSRSIMFANKLVQGETIIEKCNNIMNAFSLNNSGTIELFTENAMNRNAKSKNAKKVIIYGAGIIGKRIYNELALRSDYIILGWTDLNYDNDIGKALNLISLNNALEMEYDMIVIAMGINAAKSARLILRERGISRNCIVEAGDICNG